MRGEVGTYNARTSSIEGAEGMTERGKANGITKTYRAGVERLQNGTSREVEIDALI